ncbi:MAG: GAF domain-containing protein [FCB group bacterium]|nr:GAF domain-containing protein [FCB group bacterium]
MLKQNSPLQESLNLKTEIKERVLIIDDEKRLCDSLTSLLTDSGFEVKAFQDSRKAAEEIKIGHFDLILSDIKMPGLTGIDLLRLARAVDPQALVILMTGFASLESALEAINQGAYDYLLKPVEFPQLELVIRRGLEKRRLGKAKSFLLSELQMKNIELQDRLEEINALYEAGRSLGSTIELQQLLSTIIGLATGVLHAKSGSIMLLNEKRTHLEIAAANGLDEEVIRTTSLPIGSSIAGHVAETGEPLFISDVETDKRFQRENREERYGHASLLSVPLKVKSRVIGVINIAHKESNEEFSEHDLKLLTTFANQAAIAIDHASTFHQLKRRVLELSTLQEISDAMSRAGSVENLQEIIFWGIRNLMPADLALWFRWNGHDNTLTFAGSAGNVKIDLELSIECPEDDLTEPAQAQKIILDNLPEDSGIPNETFSTHLIFSGSRLAYVFCLTAATENCYSPEDEKIAGLIASQTVSMYEREKAILNATRLLTMGNMISEISHDMRKPLTSIRGSLQIIRSRWPELVDDSELFITAEEEVHRLNELVRELVDFSNPKKYQTERVDIPGIMERATHLVKPDMDKNNIVCLTEFEENLPEIFINKNQIMEMLLNLVINAIEAIGSEGGTINLKASSKDLDNQKMIRMEISDTGCGLDEKGQAIIFDRYYTSKETGTGLGLAVVERIVSAHNGRIELKSKKNHGTTFIIHLPC